MNDTEASRGADDPWPKAFTELKPGSRGWSGSPGCLSLLGGPLVGLGVWLAATAVMLGPFLASQTIQIAVGAFLAAAGLTMVVSRMRRVSAAGSRPARVALGEGQRLTPGATVPVRLTLDGPARLAELTITAVCERQYRRDSTTPGTGSASSEAATETVWSQELLRQADISLGPRQRLSREAAFSISRIAKASGPTLPSGDIVWRLEVARRSRSGRETQDIFALHVGLSDDPDSAVQPAAASAARPAGKKTLLDLVGPGVGCLVIPLAFLLVGPVFLYFYFSGVPTKRGNPVMPLIVGVLFTLVGLVGLWSVVSDFIRGRRTSGARRFGKGDPRRLP